MPKSQQDKNHLQTKIVEPQKKIIVVVGKMGQGKSSFIRSFIDEQDKQKIYIGSKQESATTKCQSYKISKKAKQLMKIPIQEEIYLLDTPGVNSYAKNYMIMEEIRHYILNDKFTIISIIFIRSSSQQREESGYNNYKTFFEIFPVWRKLKQKISMFVFTKYDQVVTSQNDFQQNVISTKQYFEQANLAFLSKNMIYWCSKSFEDNKAQIFLQLFPNLLKVVQEQMQNIGYLLAEREKNNIKYEQFKQLSNQCDLKILKNLRNYIDNNTISLMKSEMTIPFQPNFEVGTGNVMAVALGVQGIILVPGIGVAILADTAIITATAVFGWIAAPILISGALIYGGLKMIGSQKQEKAQEGLKKIHETINCGELQNEILDRQLQNKILEEALQKILQSYLKREIILQFKAEDGHLHISKKNWILSIKVAQTKIDGEKFSLKQWSQSATEKQWKPLNLQKNKNGEQTYVLKFWIKMAYNLRIDFLRPSNKQIENIIFKTLQMQYNL